MTTPTVEKIKRGIARREADAAWVRGAEDARIAEGEVLDDEGVESKKKTFAQRITALDLYCALDLDGTDSDNSKRMLARYSDKLLHVAGLGTLAWTGKRWTLEEKDDAPLNRAAQDTAELVSLEAKVLDTIFGLGFFDEDEKGNRPNGFYCVSKKYAKEVREGTEGTGMRVFCYEELTARATTAKSAKAIKAMATLALDHMQIRQDRVDAQKHLLTCQNGTVDLRTGDLLHFEQSHYITKMSPVAYNPGAKAPTWTRAIGQAFLGDRDLLDYMKRLSGYLLTGETREQKFFFFTGGGSNMKGKFCETLARLIPDHVGDVDKDFLMKSRLKKDLSGTNEAVADLRGARMIHAMEGDPDDVLDEATMKLLSGEGTLKASKKYKSEMKFKPEGKIVYETNSRPRIYSQDKAIWRRVVDVPFRAHFANPGDEGFERGVSLPKDEMLGEKLSAELEGILAWAVQGAVEWYAKGLSRAVAEPHVIAQARLAYKDETDVLADFVQIVCDLEKNLVEPSGRLYQAYENFCKHNALGRPISSKAFGTALGERGFVGMKKGGKMYRVGMKLNKYGLAYMRDNAPESEAPFDVIETAIAAE